MNIYVWKGDQQYGPYTEEQVRDFIAAGNFTADDQARRDAGRWQTLGELVSIAAPATPVVPAAGFSLSNPPPPPGPGAPAPGGFSLNNPPPAPVLAPPAASGAVPPQGSSALPKLATGIVVLLVAAAIGYFVLWKKPANPVAPAPVDYNPAVSAAPAPAASTPSPSPEAPPAPVQHTSTASAPSPIPAAPAPTPEAPALPPASVAAQTPASPPPEAPAPASVPAAPTPVPVSLPAAPAPAPTSAMASGPMSDEASEGPNAAPPAPAPVASDSNGGSAPSTQPAEAPASADPFEPDTILDECVVKQGFGSSFDSGRFESRFAGSTVEYTGTVARLNDSEGLVVFHGGGTYPKNWDLQLNREGVSFSSGRRYHVIFHLRSVRAVPFGGFSFRGTVVSKSRD